MRWERFDIELPVDFPVDATDSLHAHMSDRHPDANHLPEWKEWAAGLNGVIYRFLACDESGSAAITSLRESSSPAQPERYRQERSLFAFFFEGLSALECLSYGLYFVASLADGAHFPYDVNRRLVTLKYVSDRFGSHPVFREDETAIELQSLVTSNEFVEWGEIRNFLGHRGAPGRSFYEGGERSGGADWNLPIESVNVATILEPAELQKRRDWLGAELRVIIQAADHFARAHVP